MQNPQIHRAHCKGPDHLWILVSLESSGTNYQKIPSDDYIHILKFDVRNSKQSKIPLIMLARPLCTQSSVVNLYLMLVQFP